MSEKFSIAVDRRHGLVRIVMKGFFSREDLAAFVDARREAHSALGWPRNAHLTLNDVREMKIQAQDTVDLPDAQADAIAIAPGFGGAPDLHRWQGDGGSRPGKRGINGAWRADQCLSGG